MGTARRARRIRENTMDGPRFDRLVRSVATRRSALGLLAGLIGLGLEEAAARGRRGRHKRDGGAAGAKPTCAKSGASCAPPTECCNGLSCTGGVCVRTTPATCGTGELKCGKGCCPAIPNGNPTCRKATCGIACAGGYTPCGTGCVDTGSDDTNCGQCGNGCGAGQTCSGGSCIQTCAADLQTDVNNCGACGNVCDLPHTAVNKCVSGVCAPSACASGWGHCDGDSVTTWANGCETDLTTDSANCGACGQACQTGEICSGGACLVTCDPGWTDCGGACVDTFSSRDNCGACGNVCSGATPDCADGACVCNGQSCSGGQVCVDGRCLGGTCANNGESVCQSPSCGNGCYCDTKVTGETTCDSYSYNCAVCSSDADCVSAGLGYVCVDATDCPGACGDIVTACATPCGSIGF